MKKDLKPSPTGERLEEFVFDVIALEHLHRYAMAREFIKNKTVLDIACGAGYGSYLLSSDAAAVTGIDINAATIQKAKKNYDGSHLSFITGNVENIPCPDASFDVAVSFETLEHIIDHEKMLSELKRVLTPEGILILSTPDKLYYSDKPGHHNPFHQKELYKQDFKALVSRHFRHCQYLSQRSGLQSLIIPEAISLPPVSYYGNFDRITRDENWDAPFIITVASDNDLPLLSPSIFQTEEMLALLLKDHEDAMKQTMSYKLGHTLLWPLKFLQSVAGKKRQP